jgi:hypothetical protein
MYIIKMKAVFQISHGTTTITKFSDIAVILKTDWNKFVLGFTSSLVYIMDNRAKIVLFSEALESDKKSLLMEICRNDSITAFEVSFSEEVLGYPIMDVGVIAIYLQDR